MSTKSKKSAKTRISVTVTQPYLDALDELLEQGLHLTHADAIRVAMKEHFVTHGIDAFSKTEPPKEDWSALLNQEPVSLYHEQDEVLLYYDEEDEGLLDDESE